MEGVEFFDTYALAITVIRVLMAMFSIYNTVIHQMDIDNIFLNKNLNKKMYME